MRVRSEVCNKKLGAEEIFEEIITMSGFVRI
jgi:hypothetical protein